MFPSPDAGEVGAVLIGVALETIEEVVGSDPTAVDHGMAVEEDDVPALGFSRGDGVLHGSDPR